ncbi:hypothetical protein KC357_g3600 [Hortaea werneckii]|nr:hypothetical protein KC357_g3600 [Hortaea werneckii]
MSIPGNINTAPPPSSFDDDSEFYEESRWAKLQRRIKEEPLIPLGCALTCWALIEATRSIRTGDKHRTNRMFRRRIYAQGFTVLAMVLGSAYWESDRKKRGEYNDLLEDKKKKEKHEAWLKELEAREEEEVHLRKIRDNIIQQKVEEKRTASRMSEGEAREVEDKARDSVAQNKGGWGNIRSAVEESERRGPIVEAVCKLWHSRRRSHTNLASNKWEISYQRAPVLSLLLVSRQWTAEYLKQAADRMWVVIHLWLQEKDSESAPWYDDLPGWVRENVRGARVVFYGVHRNSHLLLSDPTNISNIVKRKLNEAVSALPSLSSWGRNPDGGYPLGQPDQRHGSGTPRPADPFRDKDHPRDYLDIPRRSEKVERWSTWYVTRPAEADAPDSYLDLDWEFVGEVSDCGVDDDDEEYEEEDEEDDEEEFEDDDGEEVEDDDDDDDERFDRYDHGDNNGASTWGFDSVQMGL